MIFKRIDGGDNVLREYERNHALFLLEIQKKRCVNTLDAPVSLTMQLITDYKTKIFPASGKTGSVETLSRIKIDDNLDRLPKKDVHYANFQCQDS
ncbi:hypothetical protein RB195_012152 [Necator americanus]|uniref:Uncharacterized protein n=1 Tax=Necator americanus TaxID=51031 RepID=A0ABR1D5S2_NECAM